jgi:hypothetical protein
MRGNEIGSLLHSTAGNGHPKVPVFILEKPLKMG